MHRTSLVLHFLATAAPAAAQSVLFSVPGASDHDRFGATVRGAGDVNADGVPDVIGGAQGEDTNGTAAGAALVLSGVDGSVLHTFLGDAANDVFGSAVAGAGDVDGDGHDDLIVGASGADGGGGTHSGRARVFSGADGSVLYDLGGDSVYDAFGSAVAGVGDANADGFADFAVGAPLDDVAGAQSGSVWVYSGLDGALLHTFHGDAADDGLGVAVAGAGDVDGDGRVDLIVGFGMDDVLGTTPGRARVFSGDDGSVLHTFEGAQGGDGFGWAVAGAGDVDADGHADLIVGAPYDSTQGDSDGRVRVFSGADGALLHEFLGDYGDQLGADVGGAGDVDGDGHDDLIVGSPTADGPWDNTGVARIFSGRDGTLLLVHFGDDYYDLLGTGVDGAGDLNGDEFADVVVGAWADDDNGLYSGTVRALSGCDAVGSPYCSPAVPNSSGLPARILACGSTTVAEDRLRLSARDMPLSQFGYFLVSASEGFVQGPGGSQGNLCLGGNIGRFAQQVRSTGVTGRFGIAVDLTDLPGTLPGVQPGETWRFQAWFRDVHPTPTSNFTDGLAVTFE